MAQFGASLSLPERNALARILTVDTMSDPNPTGDEMGATDGGTPPDTIVLIHGFWVTPRSWEDWITRFESKGFTVVAPAYPGFEVEVEALNDDPSPIEAVTAPQIVEHLEAVVGALATPPIIMGHSAGGAFTQILLDHGYGAVGVAINSAPTEGVRAVPLSQLRSTFPVLKNPANHHRAVGFTPEQWHYAFTNTFDEAESLRLYERYHVPASGRILFNSVLANWEPGPQDIWVDYHNDGRAPLLFISGSEDHLMPPKIQQSNARHYRSNTVTELKEYEGFAHLLPSQPGWEQIADEALEWALAHAVGSTA
jgi:pimeloyl-ACP methyl ester carboxylesterase